MPLGALRAAKPILRAPSAPRQRSIFLAVLIAKPAGPDLGVIKTHSTALRRDREGTKCLDRTHHRILHVDADQIDERLRTDAEAGGTREDAIDVRPRWQCLR